MAININVQVARAVPQINTEGLTLVIFKNARKSAGVTDTIIPINTVDELHTKFDITANTTLAQQKELYVAEYLVRAGVNLLCYPVAVAETIGAGDITAISDIEVLDYKMIVAPYDFITASNVETLLLKFVAEHDVQLFMDLDPDTASSGVVAIITAIGTDASAKVELFTNAGMPSFVSRYYDEIPGDFDSINDFFGIPASAAAVARKATILKTGTPWLPVAGETYGLTTEFTKIYKKLTTAEKEAFQSKNINVLFLKTGLGNVFVSQNTLYIHDEDDKANPLIRSHVVTEALYIKRILKRLAETLKYTPNTLKTWNNFSLKAKALFDKMLDQEGIEDYSVQVGRGITMTEEDITNGIFKATVTFLPPRVIETVTFNIVIQEAPNAYTVSFEGGDL